jgi:ribosome-associated protein
MTVNNVPTPTKITNLVAMNKHTIELRGESIRLCDLLKIVGLADSGARGKQLVAQGLVTVDGHAESRKTAQIRVGQVVRIDDHQIELVAEL